LVEKLDKNKKLQIAKSCQQLANPYPDHHDIQSHNDPQMCLDYHLVDPFAWGDLLANSLLIPPAQHDIQSHNDPQTQMSLDYHLVDPFALGDDEQDDQQSDVLDGC
jgi:hypothetical protein